MKKILIYGFVLKFMCLLSSNLLGEPNLVQKNLPGFFEKTITFFSFSNSDKDLLKKLQEYSENELREHIDRVGDKQETALYSALENKYFESAAFMIENGAKLSGREGVSLSAAQVLRRNPEFFYWLGENEKDAIWVKILKSQQVLNSFLKWSGGLQRRAKSEARPYLANFFLHYRLFALLKDPENLKEALSGNGVDVNYKIGGVRALLFHLVCLILSYDGRAKSVDSLFRSLDILLERGADPLMKSETSAGASISSLERAEIALRKNNIYASRILEKFREVFRLNFLKEIKSRSRSSQESDESRGVYHIAVVDQRSCSYGYDSCGYHAFSNLLNLHRLWSGTIKVLPSDQEYRDSFNADIEKWKKMIEGTLSDNVDHSGEFRNYNWGIDGADLSPSFWDVLKRKDATIKRLCDNHEIIFFPNSSMTDNIANIDPSVVEQQFISCFENFYNSTNGSLALIFSFSKLRGGINSRSVGHFLGLFAAKNAGDIYCVVFDSENWSADQFWDHTDLEHLFRVLRGEKKFTQFYADRIIKRFLDDRYNQDALNRWSNQSDLFELYGSISNNILHTYHSYPTYNLQWNDIDQTLRHDFIRKMKIHIGDQPQPDLLYDYIPSSDQNQKVLRLQYMLKDFLEKGTLFDERKNVKIVKSSTTNKLYYLKVKEGKSKESNDINDFEFAEFTTTADIDENLMVDNVPGTFDYEKNDGEPALAKKPFRFYSALNQKSFYLHKDSSNNFYFTQDEKSNPTETITEDDFAKLSQKIIDGNPSPSVIPQ